MKTPSVICAALALLGSFVDAGAQGPVPGRAEALRVMTFNVRYGAARDGSNHWDLRRDLVATTIREARPHVLGLQEALAFQVEFLEGELPGYATVGVGRDGGDEGEFSCILVDTSRLAVTRSGTFWLSETPDVVASKGWDAALPRICTWAVLSDRATGAHFAVLNTHFDHRGAVARERSGALLHERLDDFPGLPLIVTGDLNAGEESAPLGALKGGRLRDTFRLAHPDEPLAGTFNGFEGRADGAKIDYVLCSPEWDVRAAAIDRRELDGRYPSDHFPVTAELGLEAWSPPKLMPVVDGAFWHITRPVDLGEIHSDGQQAVDHAIFRSDDGRWRVWSCVRGTEVGRVLCEWVGDSLSQPDWRSTGIALRADPEAGESIDDWGGKEWIQAPFVIVRDGVHHMFYGGHRSELDACQICLATSDDGETFTRRRDERGFSRVFVGPGEARDPMVLRVGDRYVCYYTGHDEGARAPCKIYARRSTDLVSWGEPVEVCWGGSAGAGAWSAECPFVVERDGSYYLFRTTSYSPPVTHVYRSRDPFDFGLDDDGKKIGTIPVSAPEVVYHDGETFVSSVHDLAGGIQLARLAWVDEHEATTSLAFLERMQPLWTFEDGGLDGWQRTGRAFEAQPTYSVTNTVRDQVVGHEGSYYVGTYEARPDPQTPAGTTQGDAPTGRLRSPDFVLPDGHVSFLVGGGEDREHLYVALVLTDGDGEVRRATGRRSNRMRRVVWDVSALAGQGAYLVIVDDSSDSWGHVNFDDFRVERR